MIERASLPPPQRAAVAARIEEIAREFAELHCAEPGRRCRQGSWV
jgi:hypothetical protein